MIGKDDNQEEVSFKVADRRKFNSDGSLKEGVTLEPEKPAETPEVKAVAEPEPSLPASEPMSGSEPETAHDHDEEGFHDQGVVHAESNVYNGGDKGAAQSGKIAPYDKNCCKNQADINAHGANHLAVDRSRPGYLTHFSLIHDEPEPDRQYKREQHPCQIPSEEREHRPRPRFFASARPATGCSGQGRRVYSAPCAT